MQAFEQLVGDRAGLDRGAFGEFQGQLQAARGKGVEQGLAVVAQARVLAMGGGDVDSQVETLLDQVGVGARSLATLAIMRRVIATICPLCSA